MLIKEPIEIGGVVLARSDHLDAFTFVNNDVKDAVQQIAFNASDSFGKRLGLIGIVLLPESKARQLRGLHLPRIARECAALCTVIEGTQMCIFQEQGIAVHNSDPFDRAPLFFDKDGRPVIDRPGFTGIGHKANEFRLSAPLHLYDVRPSEFFIDDLLRASLDNIARKYIRGTNRKRLRKLFRSIALAYLASRVVPDNDATLDFVGVRIGLWVAAFENLLHPIKGDVGKNVVIGRIANIPWLGQIPSDKNPARLAKSPLTYRRFQYNGIGRITAVECMYRRMYDIRNDILHGNEMNYRIFSMTRTPGDARLDQLAPLLFRECVFEVLREIGIEQSYQREKTDSNKQTIRKLNSQIGHESYHKALCKGLMGIDVDEISQMRFDAQKARTFSKTQP